MIKSPWNELRGLGDPVARSKPSNGRGILQLACKLFSKGREEIRATTSRIVPFRSRKINRPNEI